MLWSNVLLIIYTMVLQFWWLSVNINLKAATCCFIKRFLSLCFTHRSTENVNPFNTSDDYSRRQKHAECLATTIVVVRLQADHICGFFLNLRIFGSFCGPTDSFSNLRNFGKKLAIKIILCEYKLACLSNAI